ncbi:hypothetical protein CsSME_00048838 [Camellia sinensis var. sinensis]
MEGGPVGDSLGQVEEKGCKGRRSSVAKMEGGYRRVGYRRGRVGIEGFEGSSMAVQRLIRPALRSIPSMSKHLRSPEHNRTTLSKLPSQKVTIAVAKKRPQHDAIAKRFLQRLLL